MDLNSLNTFIAIAETGSFSEAGERLHLTQPAVSKRIAALEQQLNARLFDRVGREVNLTEAGRALLPRAYQLLNVLDDTRRALNNLTGEVSGRLVLATSHHIGLHRLPPLLRAFTRAHPQVALDIQFLDSEVAYEEILHGRAELAVITWPRKPPNRCAQSRCGTTRWTSSPPRSTRWPDRARCSSPTSPSTPRYSPAATPSPTTSCGACSKPKG